MIGIERPAVYPNVCGVSDLLDLLLASVMTRETKGLEFSIIEQVEVSTVGGDVVSNMSSHDSPFR